MSDSQLRHLSDQSEESEPAVTRGRNLIAVIGIDQYEQLQILHNAVSDAKGVRTLFMEYLGFQELTPPLYNEQATRDAINVLVIDQLSTLVESDDNLVLFFAGHGHTDTRQVGTRPVQTGYLIPVDGSPPTARKFSSYLNLDVFLKDIANLPAHHILVILDTCYSGFALGDTVQILRSPERYSEDLSKRISRRVITSAMADQPALDNGPVAGHSLFTGTLVEALELGKADEETKGFVTSSELALYVQRRVATWSGSKQTPDFGAFALDERGELVISLVGETQNRQLAQEALQIAHHVYQLGRFTHDKKQFTVAVKYYREALHHALLGKIELSAAQLGLGKALLAAGNLDEASKVLDDLVQHAQEPSTVEAGLYLGMAQAQRLAYAAAAAALVQWHTGNPHHEDAGWIGDYIQWLQDRGTQQAGRRRALLIGINNYQLPSITTLAGCINDVERLMKPLLLQQLGFQPEDIQLLTEEHATREGILDAIATLKQVSLPEDTVFIHYSGHSWPSNAPLRLGQNDHDQYWILYDTHEEAGRTVDGLTVAEVHQLMQEIPALHKTLILDTFSNQALIDLTESTGNYNLILATDTAEVAYEWHFAQDGEEFRCGMLSAALYQSLTQTQNALMFTYQDWINRAIQIVHEASTKAGFAQPQTPLFVGERSRLVSGQDDPYLAAFQFTQRASCPEFSYKQLLRLEKRWQALIQAPFPTLAEALGHTFLSKGAYPQAMAAFQRAMNQSQGQRLSALRGLAFAEARAGDYGAAHTHLLQVVAHGQTGEQTNWTQILTHLETLTGTRRRVWLFLRDRAANELLPLAEGETPDGVWQQIRSLQALLAQKFGEQGYELEIIPEEEASNQQILDRLQNAHENFGDSPLLVCIIGGADVRAPTERSAEHLFKEVGEAIAGKSIFLWLQKNPRESSTR